MIFIGTKLYTEVMNIIQRGVSGPYFKKNEPAENKTGGARPPTWGQRPTTSHEAKVPGQRLSSIHSSLPVPTADRDFSHLAKPVQVSHHSHLSSSEWSFYMQPQRTMTQFSCSQPDERSHVKISASRLCKSFDSRQVCQAFTQIVLRVWTSLRGIESWLGIMSRN